MIDHHASADTAAAMVAFDDVVKRFPDGTMAVRGISLAVPRGQFCVVLGPSGSGKSTLLRTLVGLTLPTAGEVRVAGRRVERRSLRAVRRQVGMIHQGFQLTQRLDVLSNVLNGALVELGAARAWLQLHPRHLRERACRLLAEVGLGEEHLYRRASALSGGQQQRVGIARAFILEPQVILADEPVASLDPQTSREILALLRAAAHQHRATVLCSLHQVDLTREFADRVVGVNSGRVVFDGPPSGLDDDALARIYARPAAPTGNAASADVGPARMALA